jgi:RNA polymerase subunit RPABC4/transcription elongation factor Spt4
MAKEKVCKVCKLFVEGETCPVCKGNQFTNTFQGKINVIDADKSFIGQQMHIKEKGKYAIKIR